MKLYPSLASADPLRIAAEIDRLDGWPDLHYDMEDGNFTPNITFGQKTLLAAAAYAAPRAMDVHMMARDPLSLLPAAARAKATSVSAHLEALPYPLRFLNSAKRLGMRAGLAINFSTPLDAVSPFARDMDFLLVMTAEPDENGELLHPAAYEKALSAAQKLPFPVHVDGGLGGAEVVALARAGAAGCVLGRLIFQSASPAKTLRDLVKKVEGC